MVTVFFGANSVVVMLSVKQARVTSSLSPRPRPRAPVDPIVSYRARRGTGTLAGKGDHLGCLQNEGAIEEDHPRGRRCGARDHGSRLVRFGGRRYWNHGNTGSDEKFSGTYSAKFVRAASGIINETNRVNSAGAQNGWTSADVWLQFRPLTGPNGTGTPTPNPNCDPVGLVTSFTWSNDDPNIGGTPTTGYFIGTNPYNVCVYLVNPVVASGTIESAALNGTTANLPTGLNGKYRIDVSGTWTNGSNGRSMRSTRPTTVGRLRLTATTATGSCSERASQTFRSTGLRWLGSVQREPRVQPDRAAHRHVGQPRRLRRRQQHEHEGRGLVRRQQRLAQLHDHLRRPVEQSGFTTAGAPRAPAVA